ncbi:MAG: OsmC family protein [Gemmatimonadota bacterium]
MKIVLESEESILLLAADGMLTIEAASAEQTYSSFHMLASALATCTFAVLDSWAHQANLHVNDLSIRVRWEFAEDPHRVSTFDLQFVWPSLPDARVRAAKRVAALCAVHASLMHPPAINIGVVDRPATPAVRA